MPDSSGVPWGRDPRSSHSEFDLSLQVKPHLPAPVSLSTHSDCPSAQRRRRPRKRRGKVFLPEEASRPRRPGRAWEPGMGSFENLLGSPAAHLASLCKGGPALPGSGLAAPHLQALGSARPQAPGPIYSAGLHSPGLDPDGRKNLILPALLLLLKLILEMREQTLHNSHGLDIRYSDKYTPLMSNYHIITFQLARIMMN